MAMSRLALAAVFSVLLILVIEFQFLGLERQSSETANHQVETPPHSGADTPLSKDASQLVVNNSAQRSDHLDVNTAKQSSETANHLAPDHMQEKAPWVEVMLPWARSRHRGSLTVTDAVPKKFNSQFGEDRFLYNNFFFRQGNGTYIEMGALDGKRFSNTFVFDKDLGWKGILIEGDPGNFKHLPKNRPGQIAVNAAVCQQRQEVHYIQTGDGAVRGIFEFMAPQFQQQWHRKAKLAKEQAIMCVPMVEILSRYGISHFNLWSLDVEGAEFEILKSMDFSRFTFDVMIIEAHHTSPEKNALVWDLVNKTGLFNFHSHHKENDVWVAKTFTPHKKPATR